MLHRRWKIVKIKSKKSVLILLISVVILSSMFVYGEDTTNASIRQQRYKEQVSSGTGTEFYIVFTINFQENRDGENKPLIAQLFITSDYNTKVYIEFGKDKFKKEIEVKANQIVNVELPASVQASLFEIQDIGQSIHITSEKPISVYGLNRRRQTTDSFLAFPTDVLGTDYMVMCYYTFNPEMLSVFAVVATEDNTIVTINPKENTTMGHYKDRPFQVTLNKGDVYQVGAANSTYNASKPLDLTGSTVSANKKIAVFGGHQCATVPYPAITACNVLQEQIPPTSTWGKSFYVGAFKSRSFYTYRVLASEDNTKVFEDTTLIATLQKGDFIQRNSRHNIQITATKPVLVAQYSQGSSNGDGVGDPMMILITPVQQYLKSYRFATPVNGAWLHFVNVFVPTKAIASFKINGRSISPDNFTRFGNTRYSIASIQTAYGSHTVECSAPFGLYSYGFGVQVVNGRRGPDAYDAYGAMGGQSFVDYVPVPDVEPPTAEILNSRSNNPSVLITDDGRDDLGLDSIEVMLEEGIQIQIPQFSSGAPAVNCQLKFGTPGRAVIFAKDVAGNSSIFTICYVWDNTTSTYVTLVNKGDNAGCESVSGTLLGLFLSHSYNYYAPNFTQTGGIGRNNFYGAYSSSGLIGASITRYLFSNFNWTGKLSLITNNVTWSSVDSVKHFVTDTQTGNLVPYFEGNEINLKNVSLNADLGLDWRISDIFHLGAGMSFNYNITKTAEIYRTLNFPVGYNFDGVGSNKELLSNDLNSLNTLDVGFYVGPQIICSWKYGLNFFVEADYYYYPWSILKDADLFQNKINIKAGIKLQI